MKARIYFTRPDGTNDYFILCGSVEEIRENAEIEIAKRGGFDPWSEVIEEEG